MHAHADINPKYQGLYLYGIFRTLCHTIYRQASGRHLYPCHSHNSTERPMADTSMPQLQQYRGLWQTHPCPSHNSTERPMADTSMPQSQQYREAYGKHIHAPVTTVERPLAVAAVPVIRIKASCIHSCAAQYREASGRHTYMLQSTDTPMAVIACAAQYREASGSAGYASHNTGASISVIAVLHGGLWQSWSCFTPHWGLYSSHSCAS